MEFIAFDLETTGIGEGTEILEFAFVRFVDGKPAESLTSLVRPSPSAKWTKEAVEKHGITKTAVRNCLPLHNYIQVIQEFTVGKLLIAHNAKFDVERLAKNLGIYVSAYCSMNMFRDQNRFQPSGLDDIALTMGIARPPKHRAQEDAIACGLVAIALATTRGVENSETFRATFRKFLVDPPAKGASQAFTVGSFSQRIRKEEYSQYSQSADFGRLFNEQLSGKRIIFSNVKQLKHGQAQALLLLFGGFSQDNVARDTDFLVVSSLQTLTTKVRDANHINSRGGSIKIITEDQFIAMAQSQDTRKLAWRAVPDNLVGSTSR